VGLWIADCQLAISEWHIAKKPIANRQSQIDNQSTHPLPADGTDLMPLSRLCQTASIAN